MNGMTAEQMLALQKQLDDWKAQQGGGAALSAGGVPAAPMQAMQAPLAALSSGPTGFMVPVTLETAAGEVTCYVAFGPEAMRDPKACLNALEVANWKVKAWNRNAGGAGGGSGGNYPSRGGGYNGGGYNRGGRF